MSKTLLQKLGYAPGAPGLVLNAPADLASQFEAVTPSDAPDWLLAFAMDQAALAQAAARAIPLYRRGGRLWFAYPKKTGAIKTDLTRDIGWAPVESQGLLGVSQIALDATWSALRFRYRDEIAKLTRKNA